MPAAAKVSARMSAADKAKVAYRLAEAAHDFLSGGKPEQHVLLCAAMTLAARCALDYGASSKKALDFLARIYGSMEVERGQDLAGSVGGG